MWEIFEWYFGIFGFTLKEGFLLCTIPLIIDFPRSIGKIIFVPIIKYKEKKRFELENKTPIEKRVLPPISIIIPAHNEAAKIERSIKTIIEARYPKEKKEIIVIDDGSTDNTYALALPYARRGDIKLFRREIKSGSKGKAINYGLLFAKNEIVLIVDADTQYDVNSLYEIVKPFQDRDVTAVAGNVQITNKNNLISLCQAYEYQLSMELGKRIQALFGSVLIASGAFGAFKKENVRSIGKYDDDTITEDFDTSLKMLKRSKIIYAPKALAWTICPDSWKVWWKQRVRWSRGELECFIKHKDLMFRRRYGFIGMVNIPDMFLIDILFLFLRFFWTFYWSIILVLIPSIYDGVTSGLEFIDVYSRIVMMIFGIYMFLELITLLPAMSAVTLKRDLKYFPLTIFIVLVYRPIYAVARLKSYFDVFLKREAHW